MVIKKGKKKKDELKHLKKGYYKELVKIARKKIKTKAVKDKFVKKGVDPTKLKPVNILGGNR